MSEYNPAEIEPKWQRFWEENKTFRAVEDPSKKKYYILDMFPYPSAAGLHVGHPEGYTATDILARYYRMRGLNVLHPMGWDAFGLPAEQHAIKTGTHPRVLTQQNIDNFRRQIKRLGFSYDWDREISTCDPDYYKWTQWIFLKLYEKGLAYVAEVPVNWCPALGTVLANEEVKDGKSERGGHPVIRLPMRQWVLKITEYAERLLNDLDDLDWPESIKEMQRNWIGKSTGAECDFPLVGHQESIRIYTTRPDTMFGATFLVLAPEHPLVKKITTDEQRAAVEAYIQETQKKSELARTDLAKEKTGVFTGAFAKNPATGKEIPVWIADYVLMTYGTGAIMAVPGQDERDWEFAEVYDLPIIRTVKPPEDFEGKAYLGDGPAINSGFLDGLHVEEAKKKMIAWLEEQKIGKGAVRYKLRDWIFSRQRYWGEPFPILFDQEGNPKPLPESELPVTLPEVESYKPTGKPESPLAGIEWWVNVKDPETGAPMRRETNTMPQWAGSCWYYLRYLDPKNDKEAFSKEKERYWMPVDLYVGGAEHAVLHLLYARFWHKVLYDLGYVSTKEPFQKLRNQGMILGLSYAYYRDAEGKLYSYKEVKARDGKHLNASGAELEALYVHPDKVVWKKVTEGNKERDVPFHPEHPELELYEEMEKMSKSRGNVVNPDDIVAEYGADSLRLYEMFMGPLEVVKPWSTRNVEGVYRFLKRVWRLYTDEDGKRPLVDTPPREELRRSLHKVIKAVTEDLEGMRFNTAIAQMMGFVNELYKESSLPREVAVTFVKLLAPFAPHIGEELWEMLGHKDTLAYEPWPSYDPELVKDDTITIAVQVNGKRRGEITIPVEAPQEEVLRIAKEDPTIAPHLAGKTIAREIYVKKKIVNLVVK